MAKEASMCLLFLSFLIICCSGTLVGFSYRERDDTASPTSAGPTFLEKNKISQSRIRLHVTDRKISTLTNSDLSVDFFLSKSLVEDFITSKSSGVSWLKAHLVSFLPQVDIRSIIVSCGSECSGQNELPLLLSTLRSFHSVLSNLQINREVKVSVAFPLSFLEKLNASHDNDLLRTLRFIKEINTFIMIEDSIDGELSMGDHFVQHVIERATLAASVLPFKDVPMVLTIKSRVISSSKELAQFTKGVSKYLEARSHITKRILALYAEVHTTDEGVAQKELKREEEEIFPLSQREKLSKVDTRRTLDETSNSPTTVSPTNPTSATPVITPPDTPAIITVPSSNPVTVSPTNPAASPITVPSSTPPAPLSPTNPANSPVPVTNPAASYPPPSGSVPVTNPQPPPATTSAPATQGQSWCVAKSGVSESALQSALDYACGMGSIDCSQIQQGGSCYNPNSIQNHASFAFNSYYQKNPSPTSCDFGGAATIVTTNPSTGSCIYPSSSAAGTSGSSSPPSAFGSQSPPDVDTSHSAGLRPFLGSMVLVISLVAGRLSMSQ